MRNLKDIEDAGWSFVVGGKLPDIPYQVTQWRRVHPDAEPVDGLILTQPAVMGTKADLRDTAPTTTNIGLTGHDAPCTVSTPI